MTNPYVSWWQTWIKSCEMAAAAPLVMAARLQRMWAAGPNPSSRDRREMARMGQEKLDALQEGARAVTTAWARSVIALWQPWTYARLAVAPVHRRVVANRRRLAR